MTALYADTSALARVYLGDEPEWEPLEALLFETDAFVVTSELSSVELARAVAAAERARRIESAELLLETIDQDLGTVIELVRLQPETVLPTARRVLIEHRVGTLDALHLAVAIELRETEGASNTIFVTRDRDQAAAAKALGFPLL
jgi:predicted nucleic acid-binding protein